MNNRSCMSDRIRNQIAARIVDGRLQPGERLYELALAREFDTSQTPVREALRELETLRLVESVPYRGTRVRAVSNREMVEAYVVRGALEALAAELSAASFKENVGSLRRILRQLHQALDAGELEEYGRQNYEFHRVIVLAAGNDVLLKSWESLAIETRMRLNLARIDQSKIPDRAHDHDEIADALERGDGKLAGKLLREHAESFCSLWPEANIPQSAAS
jgi:DNA-binding GntR family transcriptional regulator